MATVSSEQLGSPCGSGEPLHIVAHLKTGVVLTRPLMLDALLAWAVANQERRLPPLPGEDSPTIEIPIQRSKCGRFHLCSQGHAVRELSEVRHKNRRPPAMEYARLGSSKIRRVDISVGANKSYRVPYELRLLEGDRIEWWCLGDADRILSLLSMVHYLGRHRGSGKGRLDLHGTPWTVEPCETWDGFPVVRDGEPLRQLPVDWDLPGGIKTFRNLTYPYWDKTREELLLCPSTM